MDTVGVEPANPPCKGGMAPRHLRPINRGDEGYCHLIS